MSKFQEKEKAIKLRKAGYSYSEILKEVPVAKSTLSEWLYSIGLSKKQKQRLTEKKLASALRGAQRKKRQRVELTERIYREAEKEIKGIMERELWLMGIMLYWAEGSKEKENNIGAGVKFTNSDPFMVKLFLKWLSEILKIDKERIKAEIYIHENHKNRINEVINYWSRQIEMPKTSFSNVYFKKNKIKTNRTNTGSLYYGLVRIKVNASSSLNRKICGWIRGINKYYWGIV